MEMTFEQYQQLKDKGLTDEQIARAAQMRGVTLPSESFIGSLIKNVAAPALRVGNLAGTAVAGIASKITGNPEYYNRALDYIQKDKTVDAGPFGKMNVEGRKPLGEGGGTQVAAEALNAAATYAPYGRMAKGVTAVASKIPILSKIARGIGFSASGAAGGYASDVARGLESGKENPYAPGIGTAVGIALPMVGPIARTFGKAAKFTTSQLTGLNPETITTLITNPKAVTQAQAEGLSRLSLAGQVKDAFDERLAQLTSTGKRYEAIRSLPNEVQFMENIPENTLKKFGITFENGKIVVGPESTPLKSGDRAAIEDFIAQYGDAQKLSANGILNVRKALDNMAAYGAEKSDIAKKIARAMRHEYDAVAKKELPGLAELDAKYAPEARTIKQIRKDFFTPDGELKDAAINKIANSIGKGKDQLLERLERMVPGITQKAQILKAMEDIGAASGQKVGTYMRANPLVIGGSFLANPVLGFLSIAASVPSIAVPIIKSVGMVRGWSSDSVTNLISKLLTGKTLTGSELVMFRSAIGDHIMHLSPGDQLLDSFHGAGKVAPPTAPAM